MEIVLTSVEARVLGSLIEKEITTPDYYPLTLNALLSACNQKSNREPVMNLNENAVLHALDSLIQKHLVWQRSTAEGRVPKFLHEMNSKFDFTPAEIGVLCILLLRGPQTPGEIRSRTGRLYEFKDLTETEATLQKLADREDGPFVVKLPRQEGCRENRYAHLFCGEVNADQEAPSRKPGAYGALPPEIPAANERIAELEQKVAGLRMELDELKQTFTEFKRQFE
ncbi:MAG: YceH family protein [bacterium]